MTPKRIQRRRTKGWRMPENAVSVCRPGVFGNPFLVHPQLRPGRKIGSEYFAVPTVEDAIACYREMCEQRGEKWIKFIRENLAGKDLACFCRLDAPCHADILLELANKE